MRPFWLLLLIACNVSLWASGHLTLRLILDGAISFAMIPLFMIASLAIVYSFGPRPIAFWRAVEQLFDPDPWIAWLVGFMALRCFMTPLQVAAPSPALFWTVVVSLLFAVVRSLQRDFRFFRQVLGRDARRAARDLIVQRAVAWFASLACFGGPAIAAAVYGWM